MAFIRKKIVKGKNYYYLVENKNNGGKTQQRVLMYLGTAENLLKKLKGKIGGEIIISDEDYFNAKKKKILSDGANKFHVIADFDKTITKAFVAGKKIPSIISELRNGKYLSEKYAKRAHALFDKYHPYEISHDLSIKEKKEKMEEWWRTHFNLLIKEGLNKKDIENVVKNGAVELRDGALKFFDILHKKKIPLIILSSSGIGDAILMYLKKYKKNYNNIHIVSNFFEYDKLGNTLNVKEPIIHSMNKSEVSLESMSWFAKIEDRKNILLLGDGMGDVSMVKGFLYDSLIKVGFLNDNVDKNLKTYKELFDVNILNDGSFEFVNNLLEEL